MKYLRHYTETETSKAIDKHGAFFAFNTEQFLEKHKPGTKKYVRFSSGLYCPKENAEALISELDSARDNGIKQDVKENGFKKIVRREYFNHETQITMDNQQVVEVLAEYTRLFPELFTVESILNVCSECWDEAVEQDLF